MKTKHGEDGPSASAAGWTAFAEAALLAAGLTHEQSASVARGLVEGDLYGHQTHGLALLERYITEAESGKMSVAGRPEVLRQSPVAELWDARRLPGIWTTSLAVEQARVKAAAIGMGAIAIRNSHHIGCLATFVERSAREGHLVMLLSSDPAGSGVAPFGGSSPVITPNPIAAGIPTGGDPILVDVSTSITTSGNCARAREAGERLAGNWLVDADGRASDDPTVLKDGGAMLPIGGLDHGHKGYGLALIVEALTQGLGGFGRADQPVGWGASVLILAFDPAWFGGRADFERQTEWLANACRGAKPINPERPVRLPGESALSRKEMAHCGLRLGHEILISLGRVAERFSLPLPRANSAGQ